MASSASPSVDPLIPLALLEAVRDVDRPEGAAEAEYVPEMLNKRLGMTDTVFAQIRRYSQAVERGQRVPHQEVAALARLVARRPDAPRVFGLAGETVARVAYRRISVVARGSIRIFPRLVARPIANRHVRKVSVRYFNAPFEPAYGEAGLAELRRLLSLTDGTGA